MGSRKGYGSKVITVQTGPITGQLLNNLLLTRNKNFWLKNYLVGKPYFLKSDYSKTTANKQLKRHLPYIYEYKKIYND